MEKIYQPLVVYLSKKTGHIFKVKTAKNFLTYWIQMKEGRYDLILDAAHFTDYRIRHMNYTVLVKIPDTVSFSLITNTDTMIFDHEELIGKTLITLQPPSIGAVRLAQMFPNPIRQPVISSTNSALLAIKSVEAGQYFAALIPTPLLNQFGDVNTIETTQAIPHMAISASPKIDKKLQKKIRYWLINASSTKEGKAMLNALNIVAFKPTNATVYRGYSEMLSNTWGY